MNHHRRSAQVWRVFSRDLTVLPTHPHVHRYQTEPYLPLPSQLQLVLIYRPWRDGRLSRPWCEVAPAEIRTYNLPIANPALYHTAGWQSDNCSGLFVQVIVICLGPRTNVDRCVILTLSATLSCISHFCCAPCDSVLTNHSA